MIRDPSHLLNDERIRCPACDYNLTGITSGRCPECGEPFDRAHLFALRAETLLPIPIWDDNHVGSGPARLLHTIANVIFRPRRFVREFPKLANYRSAKRFSAYCYLSAFVITTFATILIKASALLPVLGLTIAWFGASWVCQYLVTQLVILPDIAPGAKHASIERYDEAIGHMYSAFLPVTALGNVMGALIMQYFRLWKLGSLGGVWILVVVGVCVWWVVALAIYKWETTRRRAGIVYLVCLMPIIMFA